MESVKIKLRPESEGFHVTLSYKEDSQDGFLPGVPPVLDETFRHWQGTYRNLEGVRSHFTRLSKVVVDHHSPDEGDRFVAEVQDLFNEWLSSTHRHWQDIRDALIFVFGQLGGKREIVPILLDTNDVELSRLPWQEWDLLNNRGFQTELALRVRERFGHSIKEVIPQEKVQILVLVGCAKNLDISKDLAIIEELQNSRAADVTLLREPRRQDFQDALRDQDYHIFVYIGHSRSDEEGRIGWLQLTESDSISIDDFKLAFQKAIERGLQLAIFNSCDGLGLAYQLAELNLPRCIVMREPVPDEAAAAFLQHFLREFSQNKSLFAALHEARSRLEFARSQYPGVMWLPVLCTRESALNRPFTWQNMVKANAKESDSSAEKQSVLPSVKGGSAQKHRKWVLGGAAVAIMGAAAIAYALFRAPSNPPITRLESSQERSGSSEISTATTFDRIDVPMGAWRYGGSTTWAPIRGEIDAKILETHPDFDLVYTPHPTLLEGSGTGIKMLLDEQISFAQSSRPLQDEEYETAQKRGFQIKQEPVAVDAIAFAVHPDLNIESLSIQEIRDIYTGAITNWQELGGPDLFIRPYSRPKDAGGTPEFFVENVLGGEAFGSVVGFVGDTTQGIRRVNRDPGGIYYGSAPEIVPQCSIKPLPIRLGSTAVSPYIGDRVLPKDCPAQRNQMNLGAIQAGEYPLTRRLFVVIKQKGSDAAAGEAYAQLLLTREGQRLIQEAGFVPLK